MTPLAVTAEDAVGVGAMLVASSFVGFLGYRIRLHRDLELISGYDPTAVTDEDGVAGLVGNLALAVAVLTAAYGLAAPFVDGGVVFWGSYVLAVLGGIAVVHLRGWRYTNG